ncbi:unnamed protein product [Effrenium voratum]|nr:unnamed protein product [Effrenium voratum]
MAKMSWMLQLLLLPLASAQDIALGVYAPATSRDLHYIPGVAAFDLDLRKNFEPAIQARLGAPLITIPNPHPDLARVKVRIGTSHSQPDVGVATALDFMLGLDGETPIVGLAAA